MARGSAAWCPGMVIPDVAAGKHSRLNVYAIWLSLGTGTLAALL